jgi:hypothetical protein
MSTIKSDNSDLTINASGTSKDIKFQADGTERMVLKSDGNVGIGVTAPSNALEVSGGITAGSFQANSPGVTKWYQASNSGNPEFYLGSSDTNRLGIQTVYDGGTQTLNRIEIFTQSASGTANAGRIQYSIDGNAKLRIDDDGIKFNSDTSANNALDDYEEGTWTPRMTADGTDYTTSGRNGATGRYVKVGKMLTCSLNCYIDTPTGGSGLATITGFPFTTDGTATCAVRFGRTSLSHTYGIPGVIYSGNSNMIFSGNNSNANGTQLPHTIWHNATPYIDCTITYRTNL